MRVVSLFVILLFFISCSKNKKREHCEENPCQYNTVIVNGRQVQFNSEFLGETNNFNRIVIARIINAEYPRRAEIISMAGIPDTTGLLYLKKGDSWSGFPVASYCFDDVDVCVDNSAPYDSTSSWLEIYEMDSIHVQGRAQLKLYRSDNVLPSTFYGDVDTLNIRFEFDVFR